MSDTRTIFSKEKTRLEIEHYFNENFPEEVYCKILEFIKSPTEVEAEIGDVVIKKIVDSIKNNYFPKLSIKENIIVAFRPQGRGLLVVGYTYKFVGEDVEILPKLEEAFNVV